MLPLVLLYALCVGLVVFLTITSQSAHAGEAPPKEPTARAEWLSARAETAFSEGRFADAIKLYLDAWEAVPSAAILYNVAFIYDRRLEDPELAIQYYDRAASAADADPGLVEKARARVAVIRAERNKKPPPKDPPPEEPPPLEGQGPRWGPILVMGGGGAMFVAGVAMGFVASSTEDDFKAATTASAKRSLQDSGRTEALVADVLMIGGVLTAAGGVVWYLLDRDEPALSVEVTTGLRLEPLFVKGGAGLSLEVRL